MSTINVCAQVRWLFNGKPVSGKSFLVSTSGGRQVLTVPEASAEQHGAGTVECVAENEAGKCGCAATIEIKGTAASWIAYAVSAGAPKRKTPGSNVTVLIIVSRLRAARLPDNVTRRQLFSKLFSSHALARNTSPRVGTVF